MGDGYLPKYCDRCGGPVFRDLVTNRIDHSCEEWRASTDDEWRGIETEAADLRDQIASLRAEVRSLREERDRLRGALEQALGSMQGALDDNMCGGIIAAEGILRSGIREARAALSDTQGSPTEDTRGGG